MTVTPPIKGNTLVLIESDDGEFSRQFTYRELVEHIERCIRARRVCEDMMLHMEGDNEPA